MATHVLSLRSVPGTVAPDPAVAQSNPIARVTRSCACHVRRFVCGILGHHEVLLFERGRLSLRCTDCGKQTRGWRIGC